MSTLCSPPCRGTLMGHCNGTGSDCPNRERLSERRLSPREAVEKAAAILHLEGLRLVQVSVSPHQWREMMQDRKVQHVPSADGEGDLFVSTCSGRVRVT